MPELRRDPLSHRWVIIATERAMRPSDFKVENPKPAASICPFCPGNEHLTPPEITAVRPSGSAANKSGWSLRVIPNKFPALRIEGELGRKGYGMYDKMNGIGAHEVIIETADHRLDLPDYPQSQMEMVLRSYRDRISDLKKDPRFKYMLVFKNSGIHAGASLDHPHSQLIAVPVTPKRVSEELFYCRDYYEYKERCLLCDIISQEQLLEERLVVAEENMIAYVPYAPRFPFEVHVLPRRHMHDYCGVSDREIGSLAYVLKTVLKKIRQALGDPAYNYIIHTSPVTLPRPGHPEMWGTIELDYHWHIEIIPRLTRVAGFEWGTGFYINPVAPENAAKFLREEYVDA